MKFDKKKVVKIVEKVVHQLCNSIFGIIIVLNLIFIAKDLFYKDRIANVFGYTPILINTDVMENEKSDSINHGDLVLIKNRPFYNIKENDIVLYQMEKQIMIGRIKTITNDEKKECLVKADKDTSENILVVNEDNYLGIVNNKIANIGTIARFVISTPGLIIFVVLPMVVCVVILFLEIKRLKNQRFSSSIRKTK